MTDAALRDSGATFSITEHDGIQRPFRVMMVTPAN